ncbi:MAG TPA: hypothetical protein PLO53_06615 [Candidatus Hydrogenedentes bacterium]|nr:hypothetical protein [Candidatus Hydrogenedentota bacterium]
MADGSTETHQGSGSGSLPERALTVLLFLAAAFAASLLPGFWGSAVAGACLPGGLIPAKRWYLRLLRRGLLSLSFWCLLLPAWQQPTGPGWTVPLLLAAWALVLGRVVLRLPDSGGHPAAMMLAGLAALPLLVETGLRISEADTGKYLIAVGLYMTGWRMILGLPEAALVALVPALGGLLIRLLALSGALPAAYVSGSGGPWVLAGGLLLFIAAEYALSREREYPFRDFIFWRGLIPMLAPVWLWAPDLNDSRLDNIGRLLLATLIVGGAYTVAGMVARAPVLRWIGRIMWWGPLIGAVLLDLSGRDILLLDFYYSPLNPWVPDGTSLTLVFLAAVTLSVGGMYLLIWRRSLSIWSDFFPWAAAGFVITRMVTLVSPWPTALNALIAASALMSLLTALFRKPASRVGWAAGLLVFHWCAHALPVGMLLAAVSLLPGVVADRFMPRLLPSAQDQDPEPRPSSESSPA